MVLLLGAAWRSLPREPLESAGLDGAGPWRQFAWIALPQRKVALALAWLAAAALAMGDLSTSILATPPGMPTAPRRILGLLHAGVEFKLAGFCLLNGLLFVTLAGASLWLASTGQRGRREAAL